MSIDMMNDKRPTEDSGASDSLSSAAERYAMPGESTAASRLQSGPTGETMRYRFDELAAGHPLLYIEIHGTTYTLRRTRTGGLVLNK